MTSVDPRLEALFELLTRFAAGDHAARLPFDDGGDTVAAITIGLNMLGEELEAAEVRAQEDAQEIRQRTAELERSNADLERFAAAVAHDLRQPARHIGMFASMLANAYDAKLDDRGREWLAMLERSAQRMHAIIDGLLRYARLADGGEAARWGLAAEALQPVAEFLAGDIAACGGRLIIEPLPEAYGDQDGLEQLFRNLLSNALLYRSPERPLEIRVGGSPASGDGPASLYVADNGQGVPPEHAETVFSMFRRLHSADVHEGTGLGLALARRVVERCGGKLWLDTEAVGPGATFRFTLPSSHR